MTQEESYLQLAEVFPKRTASDIHCGDSTRGLARCAAWRNGKPAAA